MAKLEADHSIGPCYSDVSVPGFHLSRKWDPRTGVKTHRANGRFVTEATFEALQYGTHDGKAQSENP
jgi:hypothetical protein